MASERDVVQMPAKLDLGTAAGGAPASAAVRANGFVFTTGYMSINPQTRELEPGTAAEETRRTLEALREVLKMAGSGMGKVVKTHVFLDDIERDFEAMNAVYREFFDPPYPARRTVQAKLIRDLKVEIEVIATLGDAQSR